VAQAGAIDCCGQFLKDFVEQDRFKKIFFWHRSKLVLTELGETD
jgi:hypothetical protein